MVFFNCPLKWAIWVDICFICPTIGLNSIKEQIMITAASYIWLILAVIFFIFEMGHPGLFYFLSFSIGALAAAISNICILQLSIQAIVFTVGTVIGFIFLKYWLKNHRDFAPETNVYALAKKKGRVTFASGDIVQAKVGGQIWTVNSNEKLKLGDAVEVVEVKGCKLTVKKVGEL